MGTCTTFWYGLYLLQFKSYILIATLLEKILVLEKSFNREIISNSSYICSCKIHSVQIKKLPAVSQSRMCLQPSNHEICQIRGKKDLITHESYPSPILRKILTEELSFKSFTLEISQCSSHSSVLPHILKEAISD